jgi:hypothetical protein
MADDWQVLVDISKVRALPREAQIACDAVQKQLAAFGPLRFGLYPDERCALESWDLLEEPHLAEVWAPILGRPYALLLEIRPGRTLIIRSFI